MGLRRFYSVKRKEWLFTIINIGFWHTFGTLLYHPMIQVLSIFKYYIDVMEPAFTRCWVIIFHFCFVSRDVRVGNGR